MSNARSVSEAPLWELKSVSKAFPGVQALDRISLALRASEIHALVGENGSGKSTLVKCLSGIYQPDAGEFLNRGTPVELPAPMAAQRRGVATIHQEFSLVPSLSVAENMALGRLPTRRGAVDWRSLRRRAVETLARLGITLDPDRTVASLSVGEQQLVEIAKAISFDMSLLILDEPTAALGLKETDRLHEVIRVLAIHGTAILYISHRLDEVFAVADRMTVVRDGRVVATVDPESTSMRELVRMMIGSDLEEHFAKRPGHGNEPRLEVRGLSSSNRVRDVSFTLARGEVLGLGGIVGSGRTEIAQALFGVDAITRGEIVLDGRRRRFASPGEAIAAGVMLLPENRKTDGLFFNFDGPPNITIARLKKLLVGPFLSLARERRRAAALLTELHVRAAAERRSVAELSGGNQQKVLLARCLFADTRVLILDEPTQGIDVSAKADVYRLINRLTADGVSILLISSDYPELMMMSDRIAVVRDGTIVHTVARGELSQHDLVEMTSGADRSVAA